MTSQIIPVDPFDFIIFGGTGDLAERKLLPALYHRQRDHQFSEPTRIIGTSRVEADATRNSSAFAEQGDHGARRSRTISTTTELDDVPRAAVLRRRSTPRPATASPS